MANDFMTGLQGAATLSGLKSASDERARRVASEEAEIAKADADKAFNISLSETITSGGDLGELLKSNPQRFEQIKKIQDYQTQIGQSGAKDASGQLFMALDRGDNEGALSILESNRNTIDQIGDASFTTDTAMAMLQQNPDQLKNLAQGTYVMAGGKREDLTGTGAEPMTQYQSEMIRLKDTEQKKERADSRPSSEKELEVYQRLKETDPGLADQYAKKTGFLARDASGDLPAQTQQQLIKAQELAVQSRADESKYNDLALQFESNSEDLGGGWFGSWKDGMSRATGEEGSASALRNQWQKIKGSEVVRNLPPGAASDTDIALALKGFPSDDAKPEYIASFLRGLAKVQGMQADYNEFKDEFLSTGERRDTRGLLKAWKEERRSNYQQNRKLEQEKDAVNNKESYPSAPEIGNIESGYKYLGGDPALEKSWRKM